MILLIDNYDSFVHNLARYVAELDYSYQVCRNDAISLQEIKALNPTHIIISPGPKAPQDAGISVPLIQTFAKEIPILGVCLGHQAIAYAFGGKIERARYPKHGKSIAILHNEQDIFLNVANPFTAGLYHSLQVSDENFPSQLSIMARSEKGIIMAIRHQQYPIFGVQFHPESVITTHGHLLLKNFLKYEHCFSK